jgi:Flp pilus assembly protein TadG
VTIRREEPRERGTLDVSPRERGTLDVSPRERGTLDVSPRERGSMAVEVVILTPILVAFILLVVAFGRYVSARGDVEAVARDAVRAASLERTASGAQAAADAAVAAGLTRPGCSGAALSGAFVAGGTITVEVRCTVPMADLGLVGVPGSVTVSGTSAAPLDTYRRTG